MASRRHRMTIENLPGELLSEIFIRLLSKQLSQMRCVCKSWNALLSESSFIKSHLHHSIHNNDEILLFFNWGFSFNSSPFTAHLSRSPNLKLTNFIKLPVKLHFKNRHYFGSVIGSVNGLICFSSRSYRQFSVHIWNPSLSVLLTLPPPSLHPKKLSNIYYRFGFDPKTDDYKVVKLTIFRTPKMVQEFEVYSMRKGYWELITRRLPSHIPLIPEPDQICVDGHNGSLHWLGYAGLEHKRPTIGAFDLGAETFCEISLPDSILDNNNNRSNVLGVLSGKLCVISRVKGGECTVWVMNEYGVVGSWVKHHAFSQFSGDITPYGFTSRGEFIFRGDDGFSLYDPIKAQTKILKVMDGLFITKSIVEYVDSLVWVAPTKNEMGCYKRQNIITTLHDAMFFVWDFVKFLGF